MPLFPHRISKITAPIRIQNRRRLDVSPLPADCAKIEADLIGQLAHDVYLAGGQFAGWPTVARVDDSVFGSCIEANGWAVPR